MATKLTTQQFVQKAKEVHGDFYDYSQVEYVNNSTNVIITCPIHGDFEQTPHKHLLGRGCKQCGIASSKKIRSSSTEEFVQKAKAIHGDKYDYSNVDYKSNHIKVTIICPKHGEFYQTPANHKDGKGCNECRYDNQSTTLRCDIERFTDKAKSVHGDKYNYHKAKYINAHTNITVTCPIHGDFVQTPANHLQGSQCPACSNTGPSKKEQEVNDFIESLGINTIQNDRTVIKPKEIDILIE